MARVWNDGPVCRSMMTTRTPRRPSWLASMSPVGPAPTTRTSVSTADLVEQSFRYAAAQVQPDPRADHAQQERREQPLSIADPPAECASDAGAHPCEQSVHPCLR